MSPPSVGNSIDAGTESHAAASSDSMLVLTVSTVPVTTSTRTIRVAVDGDPATITARVPSVQTYGDLQESRPTSSGSSSPDSGSSTPNLVNPAFSYPHTMRPSSRKPNDRAPNTHAG